MEYAKTAHNEGAGKVNSPKKEIKFTLFLVFSDGF
jgi:hypothetical protein